MTSVPAVNPWRLRWSYCSVQPRDRQSKMAYFESLVHRVRSGGRVTRSFVKTCPFIHNILGEIFVKKPLNLQTIWSNLPDTLWKPYRKYMKGRATWPPDHVPLLLEKVWRCPQNLTIFLKMRFWSTYKILSQMKSLWRNHLICFWDEFFHQTMKIVCQEESNFFLLGGCNLLHI